MKNNADILKEVEKEMLRFKDKLEAAIKEQAINKDYSPSKKMASVKRAALDLKNELTKITQISQYKYPKQ